jgi:hypothetical protein
MRAGRLALIPALWLALAGAAPAPSHDALFECRLPRGQVDAALASLPLMAGTAPRVSPAKTSSAYAVPPGMQLYGYTPRMLAGTLLSDESSEILALLAIVRAPFDTVEARLLAARGAPACLRRLEGPDRNCVIATSEADGWRIMLLVQNFEHDDVGISCSYARARKE